MMSLLPMKTRQLYHHASSVPCRGCVRIHLQPGNNAKSQRTWIIYPVCLLCCPLVVVIQGSGTTSYLMGSANIRRHFCMQAWFMDSMDYDFPFLFYSSHFGDDLMLYCVMGCEQQAARCRQDLQV